MRLAAPAPRALGDVEDDVDPGRDERVRKRRVGLEVDDDVTERRDGRADRVDGRRRVVLGLVVEHASRRRRDPLEIERKPHSQRKVHWLLRELGVRLG